jgi:hypothetical protein
LIKAAQEIQRPMIMSGDDMLRRGSAHALDWMKPETHWLITDFLGIYASRHVLLPPIEILHDQFLCQQLGFMLANAIVAGKIPNNDWNFPSRTMASHRDHAI